MSDQPDSAWVVVDGRPLGSAYPPSLMAVAVPPEARAGWAYPTVEAVEADEADGADEALTVEVAVPGPSAEVFAALVERLGEP